MATIEALNAAGVKFLLQEYIEGADQGDVRILLLNGEPVGAMKRVPGTDDHRSNVSAGGSVQKHSGVREAVTRGDYALQSRTPCKYEFCFAQQQVHNCITVDRIKRQELEWERKETSFVMQRICRWRPGMVIEFKYLRKCCERSGQGGRDRPPGMVRFGGVM